MDTSTARSATLARAGLPDAAGNGQTDNEVAVRLVESSRQLGQLNTRSLAQSLADLHADDPAQAAVLHDRVVALLPPMDQARLNFDMHAALGGQPSGFTLAQSPHPGGIPPIHDAVRQAATRVADKFAYQGAAAAAQTLRAATVNASPDFAARVLHAAQPTIDRIAARLGTQSAVSAPRTTTDDAGDALPLNSDQSIIADLSAATNRAAEDPANWKVVQETAATVARHVDSNFARPALGGSAFALAIARGSGASLGIAVVENLKAAGRVGQAGALLGGMVAGVRGLHTDVRHANEAYVEARREPIHLAANYGSWATDPTDAQQAAAVSKFWTDYDRAHPQIAKTQARLDATANLATHALVELKAHESNFAGMPWADALQRETDELINDRQVMQSVLASPTAQNYLASRPGLLSVEGAMKSLGLRETRDSRTFLQRIFIANVKGHMETAVRALGSGDYATAGRAIQTLRATAGVYGLSRERKDAVDQMLNGLGEVNRALSVGEPVKDGIDAFNRGKAAFGDAAPTLNTSTVWGASVRSFGLAFSSLALAAQIKSNSDASSQGDAYTQIVRNTQELFGFASTLQQADMLGTGLAHRLDLPVTAGIDRVKKMATLDMVGDLLVGAGTIVDTLSAIDKARSGDLLGAAFTGTSAGANYLLWQGYTTGADGARTGLLKSVPIIQSSRWGLGLSGSTLVRLGTWTGALTAIGSAAYDTYKEATRYNTPTTEGYLRALGFNADAAHALTQHSLPWGLSPGPVFAELAPALGFDLAKPEDNRAYRAYLNGLSKDQITRAVGAAQQLSPDSSGRYAATSGNDTYVLHPEEARGPDYEPWGSIDEYTRVQSIQGMKNWLTRENLLPAR